jgi:hypothetical protein
MDQSSSHSIPIDKRFDMLARADRRAVIQFFRDESTEEVTLDALVTGIVDGSYWDADESQARHYLHHSTLPKLADTGILDYDPRNKTVSYREQPAVEQLLDAVIEMDPE